MLKKTQGIIDKVKMKKSIFKASFEESLNLLDDASLQYIKKDYYENLEKA